MAVAAPLVSASAVPAAFIRELVVKALLLAAMASNLVVSARAYPNDDGHCGMERPCPFDSSGMTTL